MPGPVLGCLTMEKLMNHTTPSVWDDPVFLNPHAAASLLGGISVRSLERWRLEGFGPPFVKFGKRVMYAKSDLLRWAESRKRTSTNDPGQAAA